MLSPLQEALRSWTPPVGVNFTIALSLYFYVVGWRGLRKANAEAVPGSWLAAYAAGVFALWLAIGSPLEALDDSSLLAHMVQHMLLMIVAPPLILLGAPALPLLHGLPARFVRGPLSGVLRSGAVQRVGQFLTEPLVCWISAMLTMIAWHLPAMFALALRSNGWHEFEHACFFGTSILFWWPVVQPWPSVARWPRWTMPLYLLFADIAGSTVSAYLTFSDAVLYPSYITAPRIFTLSAIDDQVAAGALMWFSMTIAFLVPAVVLTVRFLSPEPTRRNAHAS